MSNNKSKYMLDFEFIANEIKGIGFEYENASKEMASLEPDKLKTSMFGYSRRLEWLGRIIDILDRIYEEVNDITRDIMIMLYREGKDFDYITKELNISKKRLIRQHFLIVDEVMEELGMISDKTKYKSNDRYIPADIRMKVLERDNGKCAKCGSEKNIHYHHIHKFSNGGTHEVSNLKLLCAHCHTDEHEGEREYNMMLSTLKRVIE